MRRFEGRRDDPLIDAALQALAKQSDHNLAAQETKQMKMSVTASEVLTQDRIDCEAKRILRRMCEPRAVLAVARATESPLLGLARRKDRDGTPFWSTELVKAGESLREDFELAQIGGPALRTYEGFKAKVDETADTMVPVGASAARLRVQLAMKDLGLGLGDVVLRCCCLLEGLEVTEKKLGWSARSGKIVLRIALQRLKVHYDTT